jgi:tRNA A-37 threonylcarbamoyl transferase component Bud32
MEFSRKAFKQYSGMVKRKMAERFLCKMEASIHESALPVRASEQSEPHVYPAVKLQAQETADGIEIPYNSYVGLQQQAKFLAAQEKFYWKVYGPIAAWLIFMVSSVLIGSEIVNSGQPQWLVNVIRPIGECFGQPVLTATAIFLSTGAQGLHNLFSTPAFAAISLGSLLALGCVVLKLSVQPTALLVGPRGLKLRWQCLCFRTNGPLIPWSDFSSLKLEKPRKTTVADNWLVTFESAVQRPLQLKLAGLTSQLDRERLLEAVDKYAATLSVDPEILQVFEAPQKRSYTELWLESLAAPPKRERLSPIASGTTLYGRRYTVERQLGVGGQGTAYSATVAGIKVGDQVVLKEFILPVYVDRAVRKQALERFENEASILQKLDHPKIVKLLDYFIEDHRAYLVLEYIKGTSLRDYVREAGPMSAHEIFPLVESMLEILQYLHGLSPPVVHRDFTPDNLITDGEQQVKLIDFNVAQQTDSTATASVVGKHSYLPPEQFRGKPTPKSDMYAFGATLYYLLTGKEPEPLSCLHPILVNSDSPIVLEEIVARCTALDQDERFADIDEIFATLKSAQEKQALD